MSLLRWRGVIWPLCFDRNKRQKMYPSELGHKTKFRVGGMSEVTLFYACTLLHIPRKWAFPPCLKTSVDREFTDFLIGMTSFYKLHILFIDVSICRSQIWFPKPVEDAQPLRQTLLLLPIVTGDHPFKATKCLLHLQPQVRSCSKMKKKKNEEEEWYLYKEDATILEVSTGFPLGAHQPEWVTGSPDIQVLLLHVGSWDRNVTVLSRAFKMFLTVLGRLLPRIYPGQNFAYKDVCPNRRI